MVNSWGFLFVTEFTGELKMLPSIVSVSLGDYVILFLLPISSGQERNT